MPRIALIPAEEALIPRPHSSASQVATSPQPSGTASSISNYNKHLYNVNSNNATEEQEYPQNPQDNYYSQARPPRLAFALTPRPARSPSPQLHNTFHDHYPPWSSQFHRDIHPRAGSPLQQDRQDSWASSLRLEAPVLVSDSNHDSEDGNGNGNGNDSDDEREETQQKPSTSRRKSFLTRLRGATSRLSFGDDRARGSQESERAQRPSLDSLSPPDSRKEVLQDLSYEEKQQEPRRRSRSGWRPSLSLIRQESHGSNIIYHLENDPSPVANNIKERRRRVKGGKNRKKGNHHAKRRHAAQQRQQQLYEQQLAEQAWFLPELTQILEKKTRYPLSYDDFEAFLRNHRAVEYLNFWTDVTAHEQLYSTFDVSERRQKREKQLEERAIARDKRQTALIAALESGKLTPDPDLLTPSGAGTGAGIGVSGQEIDGSNLYVASRSSLQLPLNDHFSFPQGSRRYGVHDSSAAFAPISTYHPDNHGSRSYTPRTYDRALVGASDRRTSGEMSRPSLEEAHISEQDAAVAAVAMRAQRNGRYPYNHSREDIRRRSLDHYRTMAGGGPSNMRYQQNNTSSGHFDGPAPNSSSSPSSANPYNMTIRGRGSVDIMARSDSRSSRIRSPGSEDYYSNPARRTPSQSFVQPLSPPHLMIQDEGMQEPQGMDTVVVQEDRDDIVSVNLGHKYSLQAIGLAQPLFSRRPSINTFGAGVGPLQPPVSIYRAGESAYTSSIFSSGQEGKGILAPSFRAISLEDLEESAMRIYQKYLIQLRTASMAAEEIAAALATGNSTVRRPGHDNRYKIDKAIAPGWNGYAEEIIAEWNAKWQERKSKRLSTRKSVYTPAGDEAHGRQPGVASNEKSIRIDTGLGEGQGSKKSTGKTSLPTSPISAKLKKRTGTGLSAMLNPILTRLMRTEILVVELPTLTINTTTFEEIDALEDSEEDEDEDVDDDDYNDEDDYDSDTEDNGDNEEFKGVSDAKEKNERSLSLTNFNALDGQRGGAIASRPTLSSTHEDAAVVILERSIPSVSPVAAPNHSTKLTDLNQSAADDIQAQHTELASAVPGNGSRVATAVAEELEPAHKNPSSLSSSSSSSLSSSWDRITKRDLNKQVTILPLAVTTSKRPSPYRQHVGLRGVKSRAGSAARTASIATQRVGQRLNALLSRSIGGAGSSSSSLDTIQVTPITSPLVDRPPFHIQIPVIATENREMDGKRADDQNAVNDLKNGHSLPMPLSEIDNFIAQLQGEQQSLKAGGASTSANERRTTQGDGGEGSSRLRPGAFLSPAVSSISHHTAGSSALSSPAAVTGSAVFYMPLECRQRIHRQVQQEGRTYAPPLFGPAKGFVSDVVLQDHYYPQFLTWVEQQNLGLLTQRHPNNLIKSRGMIWTGTFIWLVVIGIQLTLVLLGIGGWKSPWVWIVGVFGGWTGSICLATGVKGFSPILGLMGKM
ncbi:hypothetical protein BGZ65_012087 [Modicella reniformis]|uniref:RGS domain-containing protein n=1 Tax=Modicella reniformis TaxID=1440133 RepID=A0A9P6SVX1_9FUNG|nr:hypothetical protein BGZ65_012087 [Modicella reniformis]